MGFRILYVVMILAVLGSGVGLLMRSGDKPVPITVMAPSNFDTPEQIGAVLYRRFYAQIEQSKVTVFGIPTDPNYYRQIIHGFLDAAQIEKRPFDVLIAEGEMTDLDLSGIAPMEVIKMPVNTETDAQFIETLQRAKAGGKRVFVYLPSIFSSHLLKASPVNRYEKATGETLFSISTGALALKPNQEYVVDPVCIGEELDRDGLSPYGCAIMQAGRALYRKHVPQDKYVADMISPKANDFILLISFPGQDKADTPKPTPPARKEVY